MEMLFLDNQSVIKKWFKYSEIAWSSEEPDVLSWLLILELAQMGKGHRLKAKESKN
jgi:hypothetical protein